MTRETFQIHAVGLLSHQLRLPLPVQPPIKSIGFAPVAGRLNCCLAQRFIAAFNKRAVNPCFLQPTLYDM